MRNLVKNLLALSLLKNRVACSNMLCTVVMEEGCQKSNRLSFMAKFKREVVWCAEKGNHRAAAIFWT
jgi:hypothetical protein